jgi:hypothetical protein
MSSIALIRPIRSPRMSILFFNRKRNWDAYLAFAFFRDPSATPRAGSFDCVDAVLPWRYEDEEESLLPPPVPPKSDPKARSAAKPPNTATSIPIPGRVTPWLLRRVKTPVTRTAQPALATAPQKASADIKKPPKPEPPAYHAVQQQQQQQIHPSEERLFAITASSRPAVVKSQSQPTIQVQVQVHPRTPPKPAVADRSTRGETQTQRGPTSHSGSPQLRSVRSAHAHEERSRSRTRGPLGPAPQPERAPLPSYHSTEPFPTSPAPPPYRAAAEDKNLTSLRSRSLPRSRRKHSPGFEKKEAEALPPLPIDRDPQLSPSAKSRIRAAYEVSRQFGDAVKEQEKRVAPSVLDHNEVVPVVPALPNPRLGRRFLSASELQSHRAARLRSTEKISSEHEARHRTSSKPSSHVGRCSGDSRQRAARAHTGRGQDTKGRNVARDKC